MADERMNPSAELESSVAANTSMVENTLAEFLDTGSVTRAYGEPVENGQTTILPAAEVLVALGFGVGFGGGTNKKETGAEEGGSGGGSGGAGRTLSRPVAVVIASPEGVRVEPVVDVTKVAIAAITAAGFMLAVLSGMTSPKRLLSQLKNQ